MSEAERLAQALEGAFHAWEHPSNEVVLKAAAELRRLSADNEALRKDAERYRWLRQLDAGGIQVYDAKTKSDLSFIGEELDAAVDAAMAARPEGSVIAVAA